MADQDMFNLSKFHIVTAELHLCALATIDENMPVVNNEQLWRLVPVVGRDGRIISEDF